MFGVLMFGEYASGQLHFSLPDDNLIMYDWNISETNRVSLSGVYVIPPIVVSQELD